MNYVLILMFTLYSGGSPTVTAIPVQSEAVCIAAYQAAEKHWGSRLRGGQCIRTTG